MIIKQAKPTADESLAFLRFMQGLELMAEMGMIPGDSDVKATAEYVAEILNQIEEEPIPGPTEFIPHHPPHSIHCSAPRIWASACRSTMNAATAGQPRLWEGRRPNDRNLRRPTLPRADDVDRQRDDVGLVAAQWRNW